MDPRYVRNKITGAFFDYNPAALARKENDFEACDDLDIAQAPSDTPTLPERAEVVLAAVKTIDIACYSAPGAGRPAMPKVGVISELVGFKVSAVEVAEAVAALAEVNTTPAV